MKFQIEKIGKKIVGIFQDSQDVENWEIDLSKYEIKQTDAPFVLGDIYKITPTTTKRKELEGLFSALPEGVRLSFEAHYNKVKQYIIKGDKLKAAQILTDITDSVPPALLPALTNIKTKIQNL